MTLYAAPICTGCKHFKGFTEPSREELETERTSIRSRLNRSHFPPAVPQGTCDAFPDGIPVAILTSATDHRQPVHGDHGIHYEPQTDKDAQYAELLFSLEE